MASLLSGCVLLPLGGRPREPSPRAAASVGPGLHEYRAAFHVHGELSHDSQGSVEQIARAARRHGIDVVLLTDHYAPGNVARSPRGLHAGVLFVPGVELRGNGGSLLSVGLRGDFDVPATGAERLAALEREGGVHVLGHVERIRDWQLAPFHGFEVYNLHAGMREASKPGLLLRALFLPPDAFFEAAVRVPVRSLALWDRELARGRRLAPLAGHDAHANVKLLFATIGTYAEVFRLFSTRVLAERLDEASIVEAVRRGRTLVVFDFLGESAGFRMSYDAPQALLPQAALPGEAFAYRPGHRLEVRLPPDAPDDAVVRVRRDGVPLVSERTLRLVTRLPGPGVYRVEVWRGERLWILPGALFVGPPP